MRAIFAIAGVLILAGCAGAANAPPPTACGADPAGQACEVERYMNAP